MKAKKSIFIIALISLVLSVGILVFGVSAITARAAETPEDEIHTTQPTPDTTEIVADETNNTLREWLSVGVGLLNTAASALVVALISRSKKQSVAVTVNDATTQEKLEEIHKENLKLKEALTAMLALEKGTLDVLKALFAENPNIDDKVRNIINTVSLNSDSIVKDIKDIFDKENAEKVKQAFEKVSNIVLG